MKHPLFPHIEDIQNDTMRICVNCDSSIKWKYKQKTGLYREMKAIFLAGHKDCKKVDKKK